MKGRRTNILITLFLGFIAACGLMVVKTRNDLMPVPQSLAAVISDVSRQQVLDRCGRPLTITYQNRWNIHEYVPLHKIPGFLQQAFIISEDKRFFNHHGIDWQARLNAFRKNIFSLKAVRGASTITEQVVRLIHPRPRTIWSKWLEGIEAARLESNVTKADILEFYLNQVPYASHRRGVVQAAAHYFNRDMHTLSRKEMLALVVLVRAPSGMDLHKNPGAVETSVALLSARLRQAGLLSIGQHNRIADEELALDRSGLSIPAAHFVWSILRNQNSDGTHDQSRIRTTLDGDLQKTIQDIIDQHMKGLKNRCINNAAALVADHTTSEIIAWVVAGNSIEQIPGAFIDPVITPRQPGSALKPFLYALSLEYGWTAATVIDDSPLKEPVGTGLHSYNNYSRSFYGPVSLREALGNSMNIPALRTIRFTGADNYLIRLRDLGFESLDQHPGFYGDGLALGNGEVTLLELVQAYTVLARRGSFISLTALNDHSVQRASKQIFSEEVTSIIANILSDPEARKLEFGTGSLLRFPVQTAVKTGTSSDYRDAWAIGFNYRYTAGVWMGNLDRRPTDGITGSVGPALVLRAVFSELTRFEQTQPLYISPKLIRMDICRNPVSETGGPCLKKTEWFIPGTENALEEPEETRETIGLRQPNNGLELALDPRIPAEEQAFEFLIEGVSNKDRVEWVVNGAAVAITSGGKYCWPLKKGRHRVKAASWRDGHKMPDTAEVVFFVK
ncbi:MAG: transglycosylase domain-containing protein [Deltaproteobacteria bacterium]|nr:transglycosylase domain-containing protein [Deltaproteobacteria bacterium]